MDLLFMDFETYYDKEYTLKKLTPIEYILDRRFECLGVAVKLGLDKPSIWVKPESIPALVAKLKASSVAIVSYNAQFDMAILAWRYNYVPDKVIDALGMVRAMLGYQLKSLSLDSVSKHLGFGAKGTMIKDMVGVHYADLLRNPSLHRQLQDYSCDDNNKCALIFKHLIREFPEKELAVMDLVLRCTLLPQFKLDHELLEEHLAFVLQQKEDMLAAASLFDGTELRSNEKFAELLRGLGVVDIPTKTSVITGKVAYAFAKTDSGFIDLAEHEDPRVQALVAARLGHKTTLEETRTRRLTSISNLQWPVGSNWMPVPLRFSGAHTHRLSGDMKLNMQNLPRRGRLRSALVAPRGYVVIGVDMSQIEARLVAWICEQLDLLEAFALGEDVYSEFASEVFHVEVSKKVNPDYRFIGKTAILGLGYGMWFPKFIVSVKSGSKNQLGRVIELDEDTGKRVVIRYREKYARIKAGWEQLDGIGMQTLVRGGTWWFGGCLFQQDHILLPNGFKLFYDDLRWQKTADGRTQWLFRYGGRMKLLYGAKTLENMCQSLAQIIIKDLAIRAMEHGLRFAHQVHDELLFVVKEKHADNNRKLLLELAAIRPDWAPELPLASETKAGPSYGEMVA